MANELPPIVQAAKRLTVDIEIAVRRFSRYHRYTIGTDLRQQAMAVNRCTHRAWRERSNQLRCVHDLSTALDNLKLSLQLGKELHAFGSFAQFEVIARSASDLGRQCGGWLKRLHQKGQNDRAIPSPDQRAQILSSRPASQGAAL